MTDADQTSEPDRARLHALLEDAVADVHPSPALDRIRARTKVTPMRRTRPWLFATVGAVAATAVTIAAVSLLDGRSPQADPDPGRVAATTPSPSDPGDPDSGEPTPTPSPSDGPTSPTAGPTAPAPPGGAAGPTALPVYVVADTPTGPRLFREFRPAPAGTGDTTGARLAAALQLSVAGTTADPEYRSDWLEIGDGDHAVTAEDRTGGSGGIVVRFDDAADVAERPGDMAAGTARLAVQQLVYTAQAVVQQRVPVTFTDASGQPLSTLLGEADTTVEAAPALEVQAPVWVISPQDGQEVGRTFAVEGRGAFFEANVSWQLLDTEGTVVKDGFTTARECCTLAPYAFEVTAPPGDYVLRVYSADVSGGEGPGEPEDTKRITVR